MVHSPLTSTSTSTSTSTFSQLLALSFLLPSVSAATHDSIIYPGPNPEAFRTLSLAVSLVGVSVLSFCVARRASGFKATAPPSRRLLVAILLDSWVFIFSAALMTSGIGLSLNGQTCLAAIFLCIVFYSLSKVLIYMFLAERVYTVHAGPNRLQSTAYRICLVFLTGYAVVVCLMSWGRIAFLRDGTTHTFPLTKHIMEGLDNACVIGLVAPASITLLIYDLFLNVLFTCLFLYPLYRSSHNLSSRLRRLAKRTLVAALVALVTSATNIALLTLQHGQQLGWVCLGSCGADVTINALALFFVTGSYDDELDQKIEKSRLRRSAMTADQPGVAASRSVHFNDQSMTLECGARDKNGDAVTDEDFEKTRHRGNDSYTGPRGMVTSQGRIGAEDEKRTAKRKAPPSITDIADDEMPRCATPDAEQTEVRIRSEGPSPRTRSRADSRNRPMFSTVIPQSHHHQGSPSVDREPGMRVDTPGPTGGFFSKVRAMLHPPEDEDAQRTSVIVSVHTVREEHVNLPRNPAAGIRYSAR